MRPAVLRCATAIALGCVLASCSSSAASAARTVPTRPVSVPPPDEPRPMAPARTTPATPTPASLTLPATRIGGVEYVRVEDVAGRLALHYRPHDQNRAASLYAAGLRADLEADTRDIRVNGLRVFLGDPVMKVRDALYVSRIDFESCLAPMLRPGYGAALPPAPRVIVVDPGHGGVDPGGINPRLKLYEKTFTLDVALRLRTLLETAGYKVVLTRTTDRLPAPKTDDQDLKIRALIANREHADLFVSIHFNVVERDPQRTRGLEVYTFPPAGQHASDWWSQVAKKDTHLETIPVPANRFDHWNVVLAEQLHREMLQMLHTDDRGKKLMHLGVLRSLNCPGVLVEPGVITNDAEARRLATPEYRQKIAEALFQGIGDYAALIDRLRGPQQAGIATPRASRPSRSSS